jgi:hypothetical protein
VTAVHCHCRDCQYASGGACSTVFLVPADTIVIEGRMVSYGSRADSGAAVTRQFCGICGSPLFAVNAEFPSLLAIKAASLDDPGWLRPAADIWTASAQPWATIHHDLLRFEKNFGSTGSE